MFKAVNSGYLYNIGVKLHSCSLGMLIGISSLIYRTLQNKTKKERFYVQRKRNGSNKETEDL